MAVSAIDYNSLVNGPIYSFAEWPNASVPAFGAGVYTIINRLDQRHGAIHWPEPLGAKSNVRGQR
jgi:hypothetical protein